MTKQMMVLVALFLLIVIRSVFIEPNSLEITKYEIQEPKLDGVRVVFLTDFHLGRTDFKRLNKIVSMTSAQQPDLVLLGGDFPKGHDLKSGMNPNNLAQKLSLIQVDAPIYTVLGNHDWWAGGREYTEAFTKAGIRVLDNDKRRVKIKNGYVDIIGVADLTTRQVNLKKAMKGTKIPRIVITHTPDIYYDVIDNVSLILAGHTHGGQFVIPFTKPLFVPSKYGAAFASGLIEFSRNPMIISRGLGTSVIPLRLGCKPEIVVVDFKKFVPKVRKKQKED